VKIFKKIKLLVFLLVIIVSYNSAKCKIPGIYYYSGFSDKHIGFQLTLYKNNHYSLDMMLSGSDNFRIIMMSTGKYNFLKTDLVLKEINNRYEMIFSYNKNYITAKNSYKCLLNKRFEICDEKVPPCPDVLKSGIHSLEYLRNEYMVKKQSKYNLIYGSYGTQGAFTLEIKENHKFIIKYRDYILSEGFWSKNRNELKFSDATLKGNFYAFITNQGIDLAFVPMGIDDMELIKCEKKKTKSKK
jgi:hypothetical protein